MEVIKELIYQDQELTGNQIIDIINEIGKMGDIILLKNDGLRDTDKYTVVITSSRNKFETIRFDSDNLSHAIKSAIENYIKN